MIPASKLVDASCEVTSARRKVNTDLFSEYCSCSAPAGELMYVPCHLAVCKIVSVCSDGGCYRCFRAHIFCILPVDSPSVILECLLLCLQNLYPTRLYVALLPGQLLLANLCQHWPFLHCVSTRALLSLHAVVAAPRRKSVLLHSLNAAA